MNAFEQERRSFLLCLGSLGIPQALPAGIVAAQTATGQGYVLGTTEGEHLIHFRDRSNVFIKVGSATGSDNLAMGTQQVMVGTGTRSTDILGWTKLSRFCKVEELSY